MWKEENLIVKTVSNEKLVATTCSGLIEFSSELCHHLSCVIISACFQSACKYSLDWHSTDRITQAGGHFGRAGL